MKKLVAAACCLFFLQNFSKFAVGSDVDQKSSGKRVLVKAISAIVNTEANKKFPAKRIFIPSSELPLGNEG